MKNRYDRLRWILSALFMGFLVSCGGGSSSTSQSTKSPTENNTPETPGDSPEKKYTTEETAILQKGRAIYEAQCQSCHGEKGTGGTGGALTHSYELAKLVEKIATTMPTFGEKCTDSCSSNVGFWIVEGFPEVEIEQEDPTPPTTPTPNPEDKPDPEEKPLSPELQKGKEYWDAQCLSCHGTDGAGSTPILNCETKARCSNQATLQDYIAKSMPPGSKKTCASSECSSLTARYMLEVLFNHDQEGDTPFALENIQVKTWPETLYKTSVNLIGRIPTAQEKSNAATEAGYDGVVNGYMNTPEFYARIKDVFNDTYLVRGASDTADNINSSNFADARWYNDDAIVARYGLSKGDAKSRTERSLGEEPLELIKYIVQNNRPFTEILTANYTMVNRYTARSYGISSVHDAIAWVNADPQNETEFQRVTLALNGYGHSGLLTSFPFLIKYPDTATNLNRHRARYIFDFFLDQDVMLLGTRLSDPNASTSVNPTLNNPDCSICHDVIDPVANLLFNFMPVARFNATAAHKTLTDTKFAMKAPGLLGAVWTTGNKQQWLGKEITTNQPLKFAKSIVRTVYKGVTGHSLMEAGIPRRGSHLTAFVKQEDVVEALADGFIQSNFNLKSLVLNISKTTYYRAKALSNVAGDASAYLEASTSRPLSPELLSAKTVSALGFKWTGNPAGIGTDKMLDRGGNGYFSYLGGLDSFNVTERAKESNSLMLAAHKRLAMEMSCVSVVREFFLPTMNRNLLTKVERTTEPFDATGNALSANQALIRENIVFLFEKLHGVSLNANHPDVTDALNVFNSTYQKGAAKIKAAGSNATLANSLKALPSMCQVTRDLATNTVVLPSNERLITDNNYVIRSWMAVFYYLLGDIFYNYE